MASSNYNHHPLPAPPVDDQYPSYGQPQPYERQSQQYSAPSQPTLQQTPSQSQQQQRTRPKSRAFSFRSDKSQKSANGAPNNNNNHHNNKVDLHETSAEKDAKRLHSKADPRMALNEREPAMEAQTVSERPALRSMQHRDSYGNPISDPDRSNPTRSRWERPLDTIRSFEAAIDGGYNRKSIYRPDSESIANWNRRSSYYGNNGGPPPQEAPYGNGYGGGRPARPESGMYDHRQSAMMAGPRDSYYEGYEGGQYGNGSGLPPRNRYSRMQSDPYLGGRDRNVYPMPNNHRSYETVASGSGSGSMGDPAGYQTDPTSSENSSIDRRSPPKRQEPVNDYGISFSQSSSYQPSGLSIGQGQGGAFYAPSAPRKDPASTLRKSVQATTANARPQERPVVAEKRKSWLARRFSKNS